VHPLRGFHHVALSVTDLDASIGWYHDVLGLEESFREGDGGRRACVLRLPGTALSVGLVAHGPATDDVGRAGHGGGGFDPVTVGLDHFAFAVSDAAELGAWAAHLDAHGVARSGPIEVPIGAILNFTDPDGIALALFWESPA
jgi:glyoxylase I family protein